MIELQAILMVLAKLGGSLLLFLFFVWLLNSVDPTHKH
jgi:hypothetical protein